MGYDRVPIDLEIIKQIKALGLDADNTFKSLEANRHSAVTTTYYLLLKKNLKAGNQSRADICSVKFDHSLLIPFKKKERVKTLPFDPCDVIESAEIHSVTKPDKKRYSSVSKERERKSFSRQSIMEFRNTEKTLDEIKV